jgi:hypothetical protein
MRAVKDPNGFRVEQANAGVSCVISLSMRRWFCCFLPYENSKNASTSRSRGRPYFVPALSLISDGVAL